MHAQCGHRLDGALYISPHTSRFKATSFELQPRRYTEANTGLQSAPSLSYSDRSIPVFARDDAERRPGAPEHLAHVARERERLLVRGEVAAVRVRAREDDIVNRVNQPAARSASTLSVHTGTNVRERRLEQLLREHGHAERERKRAIRQGFLGW
jgi:hypothetical protein